MIFCKKELIISSICHQPYNIISWKPHYDGVLRTCLVPTYVSFQLVLFEVSNRFDSVQSPKWCKNKIKLITGCPTILYRFRELVQHRWETLYKLHVVGVMRAGEWIYYPPNPLQPICLLSFSALCTRLHFSLIVLLYFRVIFIVVYDTVYEPQHIPPRRR